ncbi:unnamed protein product [Blepharisma stoltei]|uniref:Transposase n=1 Tax=Blepharisma stoltei TaxID=1481888 RepID=A0AAU9JAN1_9CILI|nr:unnamed protein product [Blepharisma stoltei]
MLEMIESWENLEGYIINSVCNDPANPNKFFSDGWAAYNQLPTIGYLHSIVYHNRDFGTEGSQPIISR